VRHSPVIILGAGGHAKVLADILMLCDREVIGFVTPDREAGSLFYGQKVLGGDDVVFSYPVDSVDLVNGVGSLPGQVGRWRLAEMIRQRGRSFTSVFHPESVISADVEIGCGVQVMAGAVIQTGASIGRDSIINTGSIIDHDCIIAENCHIAPGVTCSGGVEIEKNTHIGTGATLIQGLKIGEGCIVAAGSVVHKDIPDGMFYRKKLETIMVEVEA
jgi:sugar O-acyltransferase (sialic acid O-acetyltransferase NeuD family)